MRNYDIDSAAALYELKESDTEPLELKGTKHDEDKERLDLIPAGIIFAMGRGFKHGAKKYGEDNWKLGIESKRIYAALQRHLWKWWNGSVVDEDSGLSHLDHAACCLAMLIHYEDEA